MRKLFLILFTTFAIGCTADLALQPAPEIIATPPHTETPTSTATPAPCPAATPEPLWVDPVVSPTELLTQTIIIRAGNSEWVEVDTGYDVYTKTGSFNSFNNPAHIEIALRPGESHLLTLSSRVKVIEQGECVYGGYTLNTKRDRNGDPVEILQESK